MLLNSSHRILYRIEIFLKNIQLIYKIYNISNKIKYSFYFENYDN